MGHGDARRILQGKAASVPARGKDERSKEEKLYSKSRREREAGTIWAVCETPEWFSMTGCRGDGRELGEGVGTNITDPRFVVIRTL